MESIVVIKTFFEKYKSKRLTLFKNKTERDKTDFSRILLETSVIKERADFITKQNPNFYNIFYILKGATRDEERTHSPFLADLLNIDGLHNQGDLFYLDFLNQLNLKDPNRFKPSKKFFFQVELEKWIGNGSIDIFISYHSPERNFAIAIENKICADDQDKQLERYYYFLKSVYSDKFLLIYLTPNGKQPQIPKSITQDLFDKILEDEILYLASYEKHIIKMLESTLNDIESSKVRMINEQYIQIIKSL